MSGISSLLEIPGSRERRVIIDGNQLCSQVHVHMQGQEALFCENMPLRQVIIHFTKQLSTGTPTRENAGTTSWTPQDMSLETGQSEWAEPRSQRGGPCGLFLGCNFTESLFRLLQEMKIKKMMATFL